MIVPCFSRDLGSYLLHFVQPFSLVWMSQLLKFNNFTQKKVRTIIEIIILLYTCLLLVLKANELYIQGFKVFVNSLKSNFVQTLFLISLVCILLILPIRLTCNVKVEDYLVVVAICAMSFNFFTFLRRVTLEQKKFKNSF